MACAKYSLFGYLELWGEALNKYHLEPEGLV